MCNALLERGGDLGQLLMMVESLEKGDFSAIVPVAERCQIDMPEFISAEQEATVWTNQLTNAF